MTTSERRSRAGTLVLCLFGIGALAPGWPAGMAAQVVDGASERRADRGEATDPVIDPALYAGLRWRMVGPTRGGRVTAVEGHPSHPHTFYMGATGGGVWKTANYGQEWRNLSDGYFATASIGAIEVADSDPSIVYVGTGSDGIRSNVITGRGIYKSTDAGETWTLLGLEDAGQIGAVKAHPTNPDFVYAAALGHPFGRNETRGVFRSRDGGGTWEKVLFTSDSVGAIDLELHPANPQIVYAAMWRGERKPWTIISGAADEDGIWRSADGGDTWTRMTEGLPEGLIGKIDFAVTPADPDRVYALVEAPEPLEGLYRSDDAGVTWRLVNDDPRGQLMHRPFYFTNLEADPVDPDVLWVGNVQLWRSEDGGETFERVRNTHADSHDVWINPENPGIMIESNDGGASVSLDGGETWSTIDNQPTAELYQVDVDTDFPYWLYAGQQDNTTIAVPSLPPAESAPAGAEGWWKEIGGCETGPAVPKPGDPAIVYASCKGRFGLYDGRTGQEQQYYVGAVNLYGTNPAELPYRFQRTVPIEVSPHDPDVVYHGSQYVHRTTDGGRTWETISPDLTAFAPERQVISGGPITRDITGEEHYSTLYVIEASPHDPNVIWTGANDGPVYVTLDGGESWENVTPPDMPPEGRINAIEISPHDPDRVYVAGYRFLLDDWRPYAWRTEDAGETWSLLTDGTNGIPADFPVRVVREDPEREGLLYAGTEFGVFVSFDDGETWQSLQLGLPVTPVTDIEVVRGDLAISTMGRSFWILDDVSPLRQARAEIADSEAHLFRARTAHRMRYGVPGGFGPRNPAAPEYPAPGATIDYWIGADLPADAAVALEILDAEGEVVRRWEADSGAEAGGEGLEERNPVMRPTRAGGRSGSGLPRDPGAHRFRWDLRHEAVPGADRRGPLVPPGRYTVRLTAGAWSAEHPLELELDPRVEAAGTSVADLRAQFEFNMSVAGTLARANGLAAAVDSLRQEAARGLEAGEATDERRALSAGLEALHARLVDREGISYPQPMLISQIGYLLGMTSRADQRPGNHAYERHEELRGELAEIERELARLR